MTADQRLLSIQTGVAQPLMIGGRRIMTAIRKRPVSGPVAVQRMGLAGDEQADPNVHGGLRKAIYAYPAEHYPYWAEQQSILGIPTELPFGSLGENLTLTGLTENAVYVGDLLIFADCVLRVTEPRQPCFKLNATMGDPQAAKKMARTGFSGFYLAVDTPGSLSASDLFTVQTGPRQTPIAALFQAAMLKTRSD